MADFVDACLNSAHISSAERGEQGMQSSSRNPSAASRSDDAADLVEHEFDALVEEIAAALHLDEVAGCEFVFDACRHPGTPWRATSPEMSWRTSAR